MDVIGAGSAGAIPAGQRATDASLRGRLTAALDRINQLADNNGRFRRLLARALGEHRSSRTGQVTIRTGKNHPSGRARPVKDPVHDETPHVTAPADVGAHDKR